MLSPIEFFEIMMAFHEWIKFINIFSRDNYNIKDEIWLLRKHRLPWVGTLRGSLAKQDQRHQAQACSPVDP